MARTRKTSREALEEKIEKAEADVIAAKKKYDQATANLKELLDKRDAIRKEEILSAVVKSGRSYEEIMSFLNAGSDGEKTEKQNYFELQIQRYSIQAEKSWKFTHKLPQEEILDKYFDWGCNEIYATGNINETKAGIGYGIIKTTFDILEKNEYIETELIGDAVAYEKEIVG